MRFNSFERGLTFEVAIAQKLWIDAIFHTSCLCIICFHNPYLDKGT